MLRRLVPLLTCLLLLLPQVQPVLAAQADDPAKQCADGLELWFASDLEAALPLLEAAVLNRAQGIFAKPEDLSMCATALGTIYHLMGRLDESITVYQVAVDAAEQGNSPFLERTALDGLGVAYMDAGDYTRALEAMSAALELAREGEDRQFQAYELRQIGVVYYTMSDYTNALESFEAARKILAADGDKAGLAVALMNIGDVYSTQSLNTQALQAYEQSLEQLAPGDDDLTRALVLGSLGGVYFELGDLERAAHTLERALPVAQALADDPVFSRKEPLAQVYLRLGRLYDARGEYRLAVDVLQQANLIAQEINAAVMQGMTLNNLGEVYISLGDYQKAEKNLKDSLALFQRLEYPYGQAVAINNLGSLARIMGDYPAALDYYQKALDINQKISKRDNEGTNLNNIGLVYEAMSRYALAEETYRRALSIVNEIGEPGLISSTLNNLGSILVNQGRFEEARPIYEQAEAALQGVDVPGMLGIIKNGLGVLDYQTEKYPSALAEFQAAVESANQVGDLELEAVAVDNVGDTQLMLGQVVEAEQTLLHGLELARQAGVKAVEGATLLDLGRYYAAQDDHVRAVENFQQALDIQQELGDALSQALALKGLALEYEHAGQPEQALASYVEAMDLLETVRSQAGNEAGRAAFASSLVGFYDQAVEMDLRLGKPELAFAASERGRARAFLDSISTHYVELDDATLVAVLSSEQESYDQLTAARQALVKVRAADPPDASLVAERQADYDRLEAAHDAALQAIAARGDQLAALVPLRSAALDLPAVQQLLGDQTTLLSYWVLEDKILAFVVMASSIQVVTLEVDPAALRGELDALLAFDDPSEAYPASAVQLYRWLIEPLKPYLNTPHLAIVPHDVLHYLPFAALSDGERYLVDDFSLSYLPSASALPFIKQNSATGAGEPLVLGNPVNPEFPALLHADQEAQTVATLNGGTALTGQAASESAVKKGAGEAGLLHLAAHGRYDPASPLQSQIALTPGDEEDGALTVAEIYALDLSQSDLVALSACETQLGELSKGDELVGMTRAFIFAGAPSVLSSLWSVDDAATTLLMERFYTHQAGGLGKAEALRQAMLDVRAQYPNPYYWSAFVLNGEPGEIAAPVQATAAPTPAPTLKGGSRGGLCSLPLLPVGGVLLILIRRRKAHER